MGALSMGLRGIWLQPWSLQAPGHLPRLPCGLWGQRSSPSPPRRLGTNWALPMTKRGWDVSAGGERHTAPLNRISIAMTTQPRPRGHSATRNVTTPPPRPSLRIGEEGTLTHTPPPSLESGTWGPGCAETS